MQVNHCLHQLQQQRTHQHQQQTQPHEENSEPGVVSHSSAKLHKIEQRANYQENLEQSAQRMKAALQSMKKNLKHNKKMDRKRQLKTKTPQLEYDDDDHNETPSSF